MLVEYLTRPPSKLHTRLAGPYQVVSRKGNAVTIQDLTCKNQKIMDVSRLSVFYHEGSLEEAKVLAAADLGESTVERILAHKGDPKKRSSMTFQVLWTEGDMTWESWEVVRKLAALEDYLQDHPDARLRQLRNKNRNDVHEKV